MILRWILFFLTLDMGSVFDAVQSFKAGISS